MKILKEIETEFGMVYKISHDTNGNPRYMICGLNIIPNESELTDTNRRKAGLKKVKSGEYNGYYIFSTYGDISDHLYWISTGIKARMEKGE